MHVVDTLWIVKSLSSRCLDNFGYVWLFSNVIWSLPIGSCIWCSVSIRVSTCFLCLVDVDATQPSKAAPEPAANSEESDGAEAVEGRHGESLAAGFPMMRTHIFSHRLGGIRLLDCIHLHPFASQSTSSICLPVLLNDAESRNGCFLS